MKTSVLFAMSLDLLREFGYDQKQALKENPWHSLNLERDTKSDGDDDEFGDFETTDVEKPSQSMDIDTIERLSQSQDNSAALNSTDLVFDSAEHADDGWGDFVDEQQDGLDESSRLSATPPLKTKTPESTSQSRSVATSSSPLALLQNIRPAEILPKNTSSLTLGNVKPNSEMLPPSNIPPPSILLLLSVTLSHSLTNETKKLVASLKSSSLESLASGEAINMIKTHLSFARAIARIVAGRKLRWKRDTHLAQSMKIAPAQAGKSGGMKLTGVDRMESRREDQEAAELLIVWRQHVGSLRAFIASANAQISKANLAVPDIVENMPVRAAKASDGALSAPKSCALCGLKRDERAQGIDINVEDSFGEWWADHWGHVDCQEFWEANKDSLQQRR